MSYLNLYSFHYRWTSSSWLVTIHIWSIIPSKTPKNFHLMLFLIRQKLAVLQSEACKVGGYSNFYGAHGSKKIGFRTPKKWLLQKTSYISIWFSWFTWNWFFFWWWRRGISRFYWKWSNVIWFSWLTWNLFYLCWRRRVISYFYWKWYNGIRLFWFTWNCFYFCWWMRSIFRFYWKWYIFIRFSCFT